MYPRPGFGFNLGMPSPQTPQMPSRGAPQQQAPIPMPNNPQMGAPGSFMSQAYGLSGVPQQAPQQAPQQQMNPFGGLNPQLLALLQQLYQGRF